MQFKVFYHFRDQKDHVVRGGEAVLTATSEAAAKDQFMALSEQWPERQNCRVIIDTERVVSEYLSWQQAIKVLALLPQEEWEELKVAVAFRQKEGNHDSHS